MKLLDRLHERGIMRQRAQRLAAHLAGLIPKNFNVLDVGCGDGHLDRRLLELRPDLKVQGVEVSTRVPSQFPITYFDGSNLPFENNSFNAVMFIDVLHHTDDPLVLLREAARVAKHGIIIKDHMLEGVLAETRLRFMDRVGNARHGVALPFNYWKPQQWQRAEQLLGLSKRVELRRLGLYPTFVDLVFGARLHFMAFYDLARSSSQT